MSNEFYKASKGLTFSRRLLKREGINNVITAQSLGFSDKEITLAVSRIGFKRGYVFGSVIVRGEVFDHGYIENHNFVAKIANYGV